MCTFQCWIGELYLICCVCSLHAVSMHRFAFLLITDIKMSRDCHIAICCFTMSIAVALVAMYGKAG